MTRPLVYVAGPITGDPFGCVRQAAAAFRECRAAGVVPFLPQLSVIHEMVDPVPYEEWLAYDRDVIRHCDALVRLPGDSPGADSEVVFAHQLRLPVFDAPADLELLAQWAAAQEARAPFDDLRVGRIPERHSWGGGERPEDAPPGFEGRWWRVECACGLWFAGPMLAAIDVIRDHVKTANSKDRGSIPSADEATLDDMGIGRHANA